MRDTATAPSHVIKRFLILSSVIVISSMVVSCAAATGNVGGEEAASTTPSAAISTTSQGGEHTTSTLDTMQSTNGSTLASSSSQSTTFEVATDTQSVSGVGAVISPPPVGAKPVVSQQAALDALASDPIVEKIVDSGKAPKSIRLATYENKFGETHADSTDTPSVPAQLAWVAEFVYPDLGPISGPANGPNLPPPAGSICTLTVAISASTATPLDSFDFCAVPSKDGTPTQK